MEQHTEAEGEPTGKPKEDEKSKDDLATELKEALERTGEERDSAERTGEERSVRTGDRSPMTGHSLTRSVTQSLAHSVTHMRKPPAARFSFQTLRKRCFGCLRLTTCFGCS